VCSACIFFVTEQYSKIAIHPQLLFSSGFEGGFGKLAFLEAIQGQLTVSKNVSKGVGRVLVLVVAVFACVANENGYF
jgi:hypothetical protein